MTLHQVAKRFLDAFHENPGHSDLDREQPIHITVTLGDLRDLDFALRTLPEGVAVKVIEEHNQSCLAACGKTTTYEHARKLRNCDSRRDCPDCPRDWMIELPQD